MTDRSPAGQTNAQGTGDYEDETHEEEETADIVKLFKSFQVEEERTSLQSTSRTSKKEAEIIATTATIRKDSDSGFSDGSQPDTDKPQLDPGRYPTTDEPTDEPTDQPSHAPSDSATKAAANSAAESTTASPSRTRNRESSSQNFTQCLAALSTLPPLPSPDEINALPPSHLSLIDDVMARVISDWRPTEEHLSFRREMFQRLEGFIYRMYNVCRLYAFGSSVNGFEFAEADLDCTLALPMRVDERQHVAWLAGYLSQCSAFFYDVTAVTECRVPIVRLKIKSGSRYQDDLAVDISIGNMLGIRNSAMLRRYSIIDRRVRPLGYIVKLFAKMTGTADARGGGLSSYAYLILVIYYLQRCSPPVVPILQELVDPRNPPNRSALKCDRWDTYFFEGGEEALARLWPILGQNGDSPGQLFLGFLRFYLEEFDYEKHVVCIRQGAPLTRKKRGWNRHFLAIEDPFDLHHNLGSVANKDRLVYILRSWHKAFQVFSTPLSLASPTKPVPLTSSSPTSLFETNRYLLPSRYKDSTPAHFLLDSSRYAECAECGEVGCGFEEEMEEEENQITSDGTRKPKSLKTRCRRTAKSESSALCAEPTKLQEKLDGNGNTQAEAKVMSENGLASAAADPRPNSAEGSLSELIRDG